ncbi:cyclic nucleotide-binding domain-containing protein [Stackebrandtia nassauensis]|uniref:Putative transcriptional regulator, Crp/Fnr family n=1 Tax=Stackebrandtia nassauensis (strain DSM 44728 / CIP 108903 / NRRL B-16338 / NBRC 102104 / LLR-40K-21) TaxID=446470 RepID=D3PXI0_STANL|nr:cyclic nucleotide-binding domain-containing protein [Stackebrandtia nassauensis]ADD43310.1 putative transcriptional regulator, Crp/Fnr family [Stackebrandtia nassauensis DSM 44728]
MTHSDVLRDFEFFAGLSTEQLALVGITGRRVRYSAGQRLFAEGSPASGFWLLESGSVDIDTPVVGGGRAVLDTLGPGDVVGWSWLIPPHLWHFGAVATTDITAILLDTERLARVMRNEPDLGFALSTRLCGVLAHRLHATRYRDLHHRTEARS